MTKPNHPSTNPQLSTKMMNPWSVLESVPSLIASQSEWRRQLGLCYESFEMLCLQPAAYRIRRVRCPRTCGCDHLVVIRHGHAAIGACPRRHPHCPDLHLDPEDISTLEVSTGRLGAALCKAFGLAVRHTPLGVPGTFQFGAWSVAAVPVILTMQVQRSAFQAAIAELAAHLRQPFILFSPTMDFLDARCIGILGNYGAACFALQDHVTLNESGALRPTVQPGELFAAFTPQPREAELDVAARAFALVRKLDTDQPLPPPSLLTVFRLYCIEEQSYTQIAHQYKCSKTSVVRRVSLLRRRTGLDPQALRRISPQIAQLEQSLNDSRASRIRRSEQTESA